MLAYTYPLLSIFWTMLEFFLFFLWIWLLIIIFSDIFRSHDMGGLAKALWVIFVIIIPFLGVLDLPHRPRRQYARAGGGPSGPATEGVRQLRAGGGRILGGQY